MLSNPRLRYHARMWRRRLDNPEVAAARRLLAQVRTAPPDIVQLGASESLFVAPYDEDQRTLPVMLAEQIAPRTVRSLAGPGYHPALFRAYLRRLAAEAARPTIVVGVCVRLGYPAWELHPVYRYERARRWLVRGWPLRALLPLPSSRDMARLDRVHYPTLAGDLTVGEYRSSLKDPAERDIARLYAYHHGSSEGVSATWLADVRGLMADAAAAGFPLVAYFMPIPVEYGVKLWGEELRAIAERDVATTLAALPAGTRVVESALNFTTDEFIDPDDGAEHLNERGRRRLATMISSALD